MALNGPKANVSTLINIATLKAKRVVSRMAANKNIYTSKCAYGP